MVKFYEEEIKDKLKSNNMYSAHGNSIRLYANIYLNDNNQISKLEIPTGNPLMLSLNDNFDLKDCEYLDKERSKDLLIFKNL